MKKFAIKSTVFALGLVVLMLALSRLVDPHIYGGYEDNINRLAEEKPSVILFGDSHAWTLKADGLGKTVYNLSYDSDSFYDIYCKLNYCLSIGIPVKTILLECDLHMFAEYRLLSNNARRTVTIVDYSVYSQAYDVGPLDYAVSRWVYPRMSALDINNARLLMKVLKESAEDMVEGDKPAAATGKWTAWADRTADERNARARRRFDGQFDRPFASDFETAFKKIIALCKEHDIEVIGVTFPLTPEFRALVDEADLTEIHRVYTDSGIEILDYSDVFDHPELFRNSDHLSEEGVKAYSAMLIDDLARRCVLAVE